MEVVWFVMNMFWKLDLGFFGNWILNIFWKLDLELERDLAIGLVLPTDRNLEWPWIPLNCHPVFKKIWSYIKISYLSLSITNIFYVIFKIFKLSFNWKMSQSKNLVCQCENLHSETWIKIPKPNPQKSIVQCAPIELDCEAEMKSWNKWCS